MFIISQRRNQVECVEQQKFPFIKSEWMEDVIHNYLINLHFVVTIGSNGVDVVALLLKIIPKIC